MLSEQSRPKVGKKDIVPQKIPTMHEEGEYIERVLNTFLALDQQLAI